MSHMNEVEDGETWCVREFVGVHTLVCFLKEDGRLAFGKREPGLPSKDPPRRELQRRTLTLNLAPFQESEAGI